MFIIAFFISTFIGTFFGAFHETSNLEFPRDETFLKILPRTALGGAFGTLGSAFALMIIDFLKNMKVQNNMDSKSGSKYRSFDDCNVAISIHYG